MFSGLLGRGHFFLFGHLLKFREDCVRGLQTKMSKPVDQELKKAFADLQLKMQDTAQKLKYADVQIQGLKMTKGLSEATLKELTTFPADTNVYESVGRMFLLTDFPDVVKHLKEKTSSCEEKIKGLEKNKEYLESSLKDSENNLREMVQQRLS